MNNTPNMNTIDNIARRIDISLLTYIKEGAEICRKLHCLDFLVFNGHVAMAHKQIVTDAAEKQRPQKAMVKI